MTHPRTRPNCGMQGASKQIKSEVSSTLCKIRSVGCLSHVGKQRLASLSHYYTLFGHLPLLTGMCFALILALQVPLSLLSNHACHTLLPLFIDPFPPLPSLDSCVALRYDVLPRPTALSKSPRSPFFASAAQPRKSLCSHQAFHTPPVKHLRQLKSVATVA